MSVSYIKVALPISIDEEFTYSINHNSIEDLIGSRVLVSFGQKKLIGIITDTDNEIPSFNVKSVLKLIDSKPIFEPNFLEFIRWVAKYYIASLGETLNATLPSGFLNSKKSYLKLSDSIEPQQILAYKGAKLKLLQYLSNQKGKVALNIAEKKTGFKSLKKQAFELSQDEMIIISEADKSNTGFVFEKFIKFNYELFQEDRNDTLKLLKIRSKKQIELIDFFLTNPNLFGYELSRNYVVENTGIDSANITKLKEKQVIDIILKKKDRSILNLDYDLSLQNELELSPNKEQAKAIFEINHKINNSDSKPSLLFGVTGSGKTLVYIHTAQKALEIGKDVLILLPEIALTNHLLDRFEKAFPGKVLSYHSGLNAGIKHDIFYAISESKEAKVIIGTRSAVFVPSKKLGLIIVDEEHDNSMKQDAPNPKYHARDTAIVRSKFEDCAIVLGSATPSMESYDNAVEGRFDLLTLKTRASGALIPKINVVDILSAKMSASVRGVFSKILINKMFEKISKGEQVILFLNRRGYASYLECHNCGDIPMCKNCDIGMTYHQTDYTLHCHTCGHSEKTNLKCKSCDNGKLVKQGIGTQKVEEDLQKILSESGLDLKYRRIDSDTIKNHKKLQKELKAFSNKEYQILIGTQFISKGLDFENVTLVGIINADIELYRSDFRASERTFQMISQVSGRAGRRKDKLGEVIIQSNHPTNYAIKYAANYDFESFYKEEIEKRKKAAFPPLIRFCSISLESKNEKKLNMIVNNIFKLLSEPNSFSAVYLPNASNVFRIKGLFRKFIIIKDFKQMDGSGRKLRKLIQDKLSMVNLSSIKVSIDIDTYNNF